MDGKYEFYLHDFLSYANNPGIIVLLAIMGVIGIVKTGKYQLLVFFYGFVYCIILSKLALHWGRWGLPMYTMPLLLADIQELGICGRYRSGKEPSAACDLRRMPVQQAWSLLCLIIDIDKFDLPGYQGGSIQLLESRDHEECTRDTRHSCPASLKRLMQAIKSKPNV